MSSRLERKRSEQQQRQQAEQRRNQLKYAGIAAVGIIVVAGVLWLSGVFPPATTSTVAQATTGTCGTVQSFAVQGRDHIARGESHPPYSSNPPTSGWHWDTPLDWRVYTVQQVQEQLVHNLEHGGIVIQYKNLSGDELQRVTDLVRRDNYHTILAPYPGLPGDNKIALTAWTKLQYCSGVDENAIRAFTNAFRDKGPELVP